MSLNRTARRVASAAFILSFAAFGAAALETPAWDSPAFSLDPKTVAAAAAAVTVKEGDDAIFLYEEDAYKFEASGAATYTYRVIYRLLSKAGIERWSAIVAYWQPWREEKPTIRARVISKDGSVSSLDPRTISDATAYEIDPDLYSDSRVLRAPLPNLEVGSVVEYETVTVDRAALLSSGGSYRCWFGHSAPELSARLIMDFPAALPLRYEVRGLESVKSAREEKAGSVRVSFLTADLPSYDETEDFLPNEVPPVPCIDFSIGSSWKDVAKAYADLAEGVVGRDSLQQYVASILGALPARPLEGAERSAAIAKLLYRIRRDVRYTGINFGENAIVPHSPLDTLGHGFGDCKDQAALLVAALRAAGIQANLALLMAGDNPDILGTLPGFGLFNHAIVYLPSDRLWIDPTAGFFKPGSLPAMDQGRHALVIAPDTTALVMTPESRSSDNVFREVRAFTLSEWGAASLVETTTMTGSLEASYRDDFEGSDSRSTREFLEKYVKNVYKAQALAGYKTTDPGAMDIPFTLTLEAKEARIGYTDASAAVVVVQSGSLLDFLPDILTGYSEDKATLERKNDVYFEPYTAEYEYRIVPPPGYRAAALPENRTLHFGPALFTSTYRLESDGSITALLRFDSVKSRFTPEEASVFYVQAGAFMQGKAEIVTFEQVGESLLEAGKYKEALDEFRALAALHPMEALHRIQTSSALLAAGFGSDAVKEAREAALVEPTLARAHSHLAWVLIHNEFGRLLEPGADLPAARAEYAKAAKLDPADYQNTLNLAILAEYDGSLIRYGPGAKLEEAVTLYRSIAKDIRDTDSWNNLALDLLRLGKFNELRDALKGSADNRVQQALYVAASAAIDGTAAAQREAARLVSAADERRNVINLAAQYLLIVRRYPESAELMVAGARGSQSVTQALSLAEKLKALVPSSGRAASDSSPEGLIFLILQSMFDAGYGAGDISTYFAGSVRTAFADPDQARDMALAFAVARTELWRLQFPGEILMDIFSRYMRVDASVEGDAMACVLSMPEFPSFPSVVFYMKKEGSAYRIVDTPGSLTGIAREILSLLDAGRLEEARSWIELLRVQHARKAALPDMGKDPFLTLIPQAAPSAADLRLAAGYALTRSSFPADLQIGVSIVLPRWRAENDPARKLILARPLASSLSELRRNGELLEVTAYLMATVPIESTAVRIRSFALDRDGKTDLADSLVRAAYEKAPDDPEWIRLLTVRLAGLGRYTEAIALSAGLVDSGKADREDYNDIGWYSLYLEKPDLAVIESRQLIPRLMEGSDAELHTLACLLADAGRTSEALEVFGRYLDVRGSLEPEAATWLAYGIMAERFGLRQTAIDAYLRVSPEPDYPYPGITCYALARRHLEALKN